MAINDFQQRTNFLGSTRGYYYETVGSLLARVLDRLETFWSFYSWRIRYWLNLGFLTERIFFPSIYSKTADLWFMDLNDFFLSSAYGSGQYEYS